LLIINQGINPSPNNGFFATLTGKWGVFLSPGISRILEHIATKFQRLFPYFLSSFYGELPVSRDVNIRQKSKMAAAKIKCTYFTAVRLMEDNFKYLVGDFQCPRPRCADPGMTLMTDMGKTKTAAETGSSFNFG